MSFRPITALDDLNAIEAAGWSQYMPWNNAHDLLQTQALRYPQHCALTYLRSADLAEPPDRWTYPQLFSRVCQAGRLFQTLCAGEAPRVAFLLPAVPQAHFTLWGAQSVGVACPINYLLNVEHIADLLRAAQANVLVVLGPNAELDIWSRASQLRSLCPGLTHVLTVNATPDCAPEGTLDFDTAVLAQSDQALAHTPATTEVAALFHTGGSTGSPKLAQHQHRNQLCAAAGAASMYGATEHDTIVNGFPLFHVAGSFVYALSMFMVGAQVVLPTLLGMRNTELVRRYWDFVEREKATLLAAVPTVMSSLMGVPVGNANIGHLRGLLTGGSPLPPDLAEAFEQRFGVPVRNILGMTECGGVIAIEPMGLPRSAGSVGLPIPFVQVRAVNALGQPLPVGQDGEVQIRGHNVSPGYTDARKNTGVFLGDGWLASGDIGHLDAEGRLYITGRAKDTIIRSSHNIDPLMIEDVLLQHPDVAMAAAVGAPDEYAGELPVAFVTCRPGATATVDELLAYAKAHMPEPPAVPKTIAVLDEMPITAIGKLFKPRLRELATQQVLEQRLAQHGLASTVACSVVTDSTGLQVAFHCDQPARADAALRSMMQAFALRWTAQATDGAATPFAREAV